MQRTYGDHNNWIHAINYYTPCRLTVTKTITYCKTSYFLINKKTIHFLFVYQLRENIIKSVTKLRMNDTESVNQIASVLVEATKEEMDITPTSGVSTYMQQGAQSSNHL